MSRQPSLRTKLIAAFAAVIGLSLLLASGTLGYLLRDYQTEREKDRLESVARNASFQVIRELRTTGSLADAGEQLDQVAATSQVRLLLVGLDGAVIRDSQGNQLLGHTFPELAGPPTHPRAGQVQLPAPGEAGRFRVTLGLPTGERVYAVMALGPAADYRLAVLAPEQSLGDAWRELLPRILAAALASLVISAGIAWWLASAITRPLAEITRASEAMARGKYDQQLPVREASDEIGRLGTAFNAMAREVARSHRAMRDLLANVSHDLKTPLTSIQGFAAAIQDGTVGDGRGGREAARIILDEAGRMRRLIEDLLYLGRIESGDLPLAEEVIDLAELATAACRRFAPRAEEAGVSIDANAREQVRTRGDTHQLARVLDNLLDNALKHTVAGGRIWIQVGVAPEEPVPATPAAERHALEPRALLVVQNSGPPIPPDELDRIFERFYQVDKARAGNGGRGLGLAIAREIVEAHGGTIVACSSPAEGTKFTVRLPIPPASTAPQSDPGPSDPGLAATWTLAQRQFRAIVSNEAQLAASTLLDGPAPGGPGAPADVRRSKP